MTGPTVDVEELTRLLETATPGPWRVPEFWPNGLQALEQPAPMEHDTWEHLGSLVRWPDAELIATVVTQLPALLDLIRRQDAALTAVRELLDVLERINVGRIPAALDEAMTAVRAALASPDTTQEEAGRAVCAKPNREGLQCLKDADHDGPCWATRGRMETTWVPLTADTTQAGA